MEGGRGEGGEAVCAKSGNAGCKFVPRQRSNLHSSCGAEQLDQRPSPANEEQGATIRQMARGMDAQLPVPRPAVAALLERADNYNGTLGQRALTITVASGRVWADRLGACKWLRPLQTAATLQPPSALLWLPALAGSWLSSAGCSCGNGRGMVSGRCWLLACLVACFASLQHLSVSQGRDVSVGMGE